MKNHILYLLGVLFLPIIFFSENLIAETNEYTPINEIGLESTPVDSVRRFILQQGTYVGSGASRAAIKRELNANKNIDEKESNRRFKIETGGDVRVGSIFRGPINRNDPNRKEPQNDDRDNPQIQKARIILQQGSHVGTGPNKNNKESKKP